MARGTQDTNQITEGVIWKQLLIFFFPIVFGTFFQQLYNTIDTIIVGHFVGKEALASVGGSSTQIINLIVGFFTSLSSGASVIIAQFYGAEDRHSLRQSLHTAYAFSAAGSIVIGMLGFLLAPRMLAWMNTPAELVADSTTYLRIYFAGILFVFIYNMGSGILRAAGDSRHPLYYLIVCCILNIVLDTVFVVVFHMGVAGVAAATLVSQAVSALLVSFRLIRGETMLKLSLTQIRIHGPILRLLLRIGLPAGFQSVMYNISNTMIQAALNGFGTDTSAAWSVYNKLDGLFWMMSGAFGIAITTFVGQNYGAGKTDRVKKSVRVCLGIDLLFSGILVIFFLVFRMPLFGIFTTDAEVMRLGSWMMGLITPCYIFYVFLEVLSGALRGIGDVIIPLIITMFGTCLLRIIWVAGALKIHPVVDTVIFSYPVTWIISAVLFILYYSYRKRRL